MINTWLNDRDKTLSKTFEFKSFLDAIQWMNDLAPMIDKINHHPSWTNVYNKINVELTTHDQSNTVTQKDIDLSKLMDESFEKYK